MSDLARMLPQRNLRFVRNPLPGTALVLPALLLMFAIAGGIAWWQAPGLLRDAAIRANPLEVEDYDLRNGECTTRKGVFTDCKADVVYAVDGTRYARHIDLMFVSFSRSDYETGLVVAADDPGKAALSLGLEHFWNRVLVLLVFAGLFVVIGVIGIVNGLRNARGNRSARAPRRWVPEPVEVTATQKSLGALQVSYRFPAEAGGRGKRKAASRFGRKEAPLLLESPEGALCALALRPAAGGTPLLLDEGLQRIDLSGPEREAALAVLAGDAGSA